MYLFRNISNIHFSLSTVIYMYIVAEVLINRLSTYGYHPVCIVGGEDIVCFLESV